MTSRTQPRVVWKVLVELDDGICYREDLTYGEIRDFVAIAKQFNQWPRDSSQIKDTVVNKYVFPYLFSIYDRKKIAFISIQTTRN